MILYLSISIDCSNNGIEDEGNVQCGGWFGFQAGSEAVFQLNPALIQRASQSEPGMR